MTGKPSIPSTPSTADRLPSSFPKRQVGSVFVDGVEWTWIYCANCGKKDGLVPKESCTFAFALCTKCDHLGDTAHFYKEPEAIFYERVLGEQLDRYGEILSPEKLLQVLDDPKHPLNKLVADYQKGRI